MKKYILLALVMILAVVIVVSGKTEDKPTVHMEYTVQYGDTLYSIASEYGISNWQEWCYNTCEQNDLKFGGEIFAGQLITIEVYAD